MSGTKYISRELLGSVADVYDAALRRDEYPVQAVMARFKVPRSTANKWVQRARGAGFLPPTTQGVPNCNGGRD